MNDVDFLRAHNIMDYSLLLGIAPVPTDLKEVQLRRASDGLIDAEAAAAAAAEAAVGKSMRRRRGAAD